MSVDTLRENFHINRISSDLLQDFLTAQTYRPEITLAKEKLLKLPHKLLQNLCDKPIRQGKSPTYAENGLKCIKPRNTVNLLVSLDDIDYIDPSTEDDISNQCLAYGDIIITRSGSGTIGRAAIFSSHEKIYTNDHLFIVRASKADSHYVACYLKSYYGARLLEAGISGSTGQLNLSNEHIKNLIIYTPPLLAQQYIGDKVRQAEILKIFSNNIFLKTYQYFDAKLPVFKSEKKCYKLNSNDLDDRLDAEYYQDKYLQLSDFFNVNLSKSKKLRDFVLEALSGPAIPSSVFTSGYRGMPILQTRDVRENYIAYDKCVKVDEKLAESFSRFKVSQNTLVMGMSGTVGRTALLTNKMDSYILNQRVAGLKLKEDTFSGYLCAFLNHTFGSMQLERQTVGGVQANISLDDILNVNIFIEDTEAKEINQRFLEASLASELSKKLIKSSSMIVEGLIDGLITEEALSQAQNALEQGDTSLDRVILSQMTEDGYAVAGSKPLFTDLDEFYDLLEQAKALE